MNPTFEVPVPREHRRNGEVALTYGLAHTIDHTAAGPIRLAASPLRLMKTPPEYRSAPPTLGQHTEEVFHSWLSLSKDQIQALHEQKVIGNAN